MRGGGGTAGGRRSGGLQTLDLRSASAYARSCTRLVRRQRRRRRQRQGRAQDLGYVYSNFLWLIKKTLARIHYQFITNILLNASLPIYHEFRSIQQLQEQIHKIWKDSSPLLYRGLLQCRRPPPCAEPWATVPALGRWPACRSRRWLVAVRLAPTAGWGPPAPGDLGFLGGC